MKNQYSPSVLSLDPGSRQIAYAYFEGNWLVDWGIKRNAEGPIRERMLNRGLDVVSRLVSRCNPDIVILPGQSSIRKTGANKFRFVKAIRIFLDGQVAQVVPVGNSEVRKHFRHLTGLEKISKQKVMSFLAERFPELRHHLPPPRQPWQSQDYWVSMFDAIARAVTYIDAQHDEF